MRGSFSSADLIPGQYDRVFDDYLQEVLDIEEEDDNPAPYKKPALVLTEQEQKQQQGKAADVAMRRLIWDRQIGPGIKEALCPLCSTYKIYRSVASGFESAHVIAKKFSIGKPNIYQVYPSCATCNKDTRTVCMLDFLFCQGRYAALKKIITQMYTLYIEENGDTMQEEDKLIWNVLEHLYGPSRYPSGGGIVNRAQIYNIAKGIQLTILSEKANVLSQQLQETTKHFGLVAGTQITIKNHLI